MSDKSMFDEVFPQNRQIGGNHYKNFTIQPYEFISKNKKHTRTDGSIDFINGNKMLLSECIFNHQPKVGDMILFPHYLMHTAYPFKTKGERRSFSFNLEIDDKIANVFSK